MTKYRVLKECISPLGVFLEVGSEVSGEFQNSYTDRGFLEEIKEDGRWRANHGSTYRYFSTTGDALSTVEMSAPSDDERYELGNYFKSEATAGLVAEAQKLMYEWLHTQDEDGGFGDEPVHSIRHMSFSKITDAMDEARAAVLADDRSEA